MAAINKYRVAGLMSEVLGLWCMVAMAGSALASGSLPAFPGAEGWGSQTSHGRGGRVIKVTNLNTSGPGSLQEACDAAGPRVIVFDVSGVIPGSIRIRNGDFYLAGQTAPGGGITIEGQLSGEHISNFVVRHLRMRPPTPSQMGISGGDHHAVHFCSDFVLDHLSGAWGADEDFGLAGAHDYTVQWCTLEESALQGHPEGQHNNGLIAIYRQGKTNASLHHNLFAHHAHRTPAVAYGPADIRNNLVYDCIEALNHAGHPGTGGMNVVNNYMKDGPSCDIAMVRLGRKGTFYVSGNIQRVSDQTIRTMIHRQDSGTRLPHPIAAPTVTTHSATEARDIVLAKAGAFPRDVVTRRTVTEVKSGSGRWGRHDPPGGLLDGLSPQKPPTDSDGDGLPDAWEKANGLNPSAHDATKSMADGYTAIEQYVNGRAKTIIGEAELEQDDGATESVGETGASQP